MAGDSQAAGPPPRFPAYLLPSFSIPFRRRRQSSLSTAAYPSPPEETSLPALSSSPTDSTASSPVESPQTPSFFPSGFARSSFPAKNHAGGDSDTVRLSRVQPNTIRCSTCSTDLAFTSQIVSKGFTGRYGRAYLVSPPDHSKQGQKRGNLVNVQVGKPETRQLVTGSHVVADIICVVCRVKVGWKYVDAKEDSQKYKIGKFILETQRTVNYSTWADVPAAEWEDLNMDPARPSPDGDAETVNFDSEDSDDCEDVFSGVWDPLVAAKRRSRKSRPSAK